MTIKTGGLGSVPKGLEWIGQNQKTDMQQEVSSTVQPVERSTSMESMATASTVVQDGAEKTNVVPGPKHKTVHKNAASSASAGLPEGYTRATFIVKQEHIDRLKAMAYVKKVSIKELLDHALTRFLKDKNVNGILMELIKSSQED